MNKFLSILVVASFASVSFSALAASHGGAMKDTPKADCKMDPAKMDDKTKAACMKMEEKKPDAKK
ncbi:MAG: hypothetical protein Q7U05_15095 [Polaromonas sp.]|jgi:hypothetical protein|nr:hypothetical protein [Polaromonas sp.]